MVFRYMAQTPQLFDQGRLTMNLKLLLKVFPVVLLTVVPVVGMDGVARSQVPAAPPTLLLQDFILSPEEIKTLNAARDSIPDLIKLLTHPNNLLADAAASALADKGELALPSIIPLLKHQDRLLRSKGAYILGIMGESGIFRKSLIRETVRETVSGIMGESGGFRHDTTVIQESVQSIIPTLISLLNDQDEQVRAKAPYALANIGEPATASIPHLILLLKDPVGEVRSSASYALQNMGEAAKSALISRLQDPDEMLRLKAAEKLGWMGERDTHTIPTLLLLLKSQRPQMRSEAISSLRKIFDFSETSTTTASAIMPSLISMLDDPNAEVQVLTAGTLGDIGEPAKSRVSASQTLLTARF